MAEARFVEMPIQNQMLIYTGRSGQPVIDVQSDGETVWLLRRSWLGCSIPVRRISASTLKISLPRENWMPKQLFENSEQLLRMEKHT